MQANNGKQSTDLSALLQMVAQKMGKTPEELQRELQEGGPQSSEQVRKLLGNREQLDSFMASPQVQELLQQLRNKK